MLRPSPARASEPPGRARAGEPQMHEWLTSILRGRADDANAHRASLVRCPRGRMSENGKTPGRGHPGSALLGKRGYFLALAFGFALVAGFPLALALVFVSNLPLSRARYFFMLASG